MRCFVAPGTTIGPWPGAANPVELIAWKRHITQIMDPAGQRLFMMVKGATRIQDRVSSIARAISSNSSQIKLPPAVEPACVDLACPAL